MDFVDDTDGDGEELEDSLEDAMLFMEAATLGEAHEKALAAGERAGRNGANGASATHVTTTPPPKKRVVAKRSTIERLYADHARREALNAQKREERALDGCTFAPQRVAKDKDFYGNIKRGKSSKSKRKPIHERLMDYKQESDRKKEAMRAVEDPECSFSPVTLSRDPTLVSVPRKKQDRLFKQGKQKMQQRDLTHSAHAGLDDNCVFKPAINHVSKRSPDQKPRPERLYNPAAQAKKLEKREELRVAREREGCSFSPALTDPAEPGKKGRPERLYNPTLIAKKRDAKEDLRKKRETAGCTHQPKLRGARAGSSRPHEAFSRLYTNAVKRNAKLAENYAERGFRNDVAHPDSQHFSYR